MNYSLSTRRTRYLLSYFMLIMVFLLPNYALAKIEPYDFEQGFTITKHWEPEIALYVAKKFAVENGFNEQNLSVSKLKAGASNNFIYLVSIDNQVRFVIKGLSSKKEAEALFALQNNAKIKEVENNPKAAKICLSKLVKSYLTTNDKQIYYFTILDAAQGKELFKIMTNDLLKTKDISKLREIFYDMGTQISELHKTIIGADKFNSPNIATIIHDDFHPENSFYNVDTQSFSLIDNESMGESITKPLPIVRELYGLYEIPVIRWPAEKVSIDLLKEANPHDIAAIYIELIQGMASVYKTPAAAKLVFTNKIIELNNKAIAFLKDSRAESWMFYPSDKSEEHIIWGKFSHAGDDRELYIANLIAINHDLEIFVRI